MNFDDPCPRCGYKKKPYLMSINPNQVDFKDIWNGKAGAFIGSIAIVGIILLCSLYLAAFIHYVL